MGVRQIVRRLSFQQRILYSYYLVMLSLMVIAGAVIFFVIRNNTSDRQIAGLNEIIDRTVAGIDSYFQNMDNVALQVFSDPEIRRLLATANADPGEGNYFTNHAEDRRILFNRLLTINGPLSNAFRITVFGRRGDYVDYGGFTVTDYLVRSRFEETPWIAEVIDLSGSKLIMPPHRDPWSPVNEFPLVSSMRALRYGEVIYGFVQVDQPFPEVIDLITVRDPTGSALLADGDGALLYHSHPVGLTADHSSAYVEMVEAHGYAPVVAMSPVTGERELVIGRRSAFTDWVYVLSLPYSTVVSLSRRVAFILAAVMVVVAALLYLVDYLLSRGISSPIRVLSNRLQTVRAEDPRIDFPDFRANDELMYLKESMEAMFSQLRSSTRELIAARTRELNAHYEALQSQINPHFLHNLFAVMGSIARSEGSPTLLTMCREASSMFRYISKHDQTVVTIRDEVGYARNYVSLMTQRFEDGLQVDFDIDERILDMTVPKLSLQPIIENCYAHGFKDVAQPWRIRVSGVYESGEDARPRWLLRVEDNGSGFDLTYENTICGENDSCPLPDSSGGNGVGLRNIWERLRICYMLDCSMSIRNVRSNGAVSGAVVEIGGSAHAG